MIKMCDKRRGASVPISHDIGTLTRYCTLTRMPSHITVTSHCFWWRRNAMTSRQTLSRALVEFTFYFLNSVLKVRNPRDEISIYSYMIKGLLHWYWWILSLIGKSKDVRKLASFDIPTRDNIHQYQCNNLYNLNPKNIASLSWD